MEKKVEACDIIEQCFGIQAREVVRKLLNLNDAGVLAVNKYVDFLAEQPEYQIEPKKRCTIIRKEGNVIYAKW